MMESLENLIKKSNEKNDLINKYMNTKNAETLGLFKDITDFLVREKKANNKIINDKMLFVNENIIKPIYSFLFFC